MKAEGAMILTIINHYILITRGFFHVSTQRCRENELPCHLPEMFKARDKQTLIRSVPFKEDQPCKNTRRRFPLGARAIWWYWAVYIKGEMCLITVAHPQSARFRLRSKWKTEKYTQTFATWGAKKRKKESTVTWCSRDWEISDTVWWSVGGRLIPE